MKQWMKYMAVACGFLVMAIVCFPNKGNQVSAEGTTSGNTVQVEEEGVMPPTGEGDISWILTVKYNIDGTETTEEIKDVSSGDVFAFSTAKAPEKEGYIFDGWLCSVPEGVKDSSNLNNRILKESVEYICDGTNYNGATITLTAQWKTTPDEGENEETDTESGFLAKGGTPTTGENKLKANTKYILGSGTWTVNGTPTIYVGGSEFYVEADGTYTFSQISQSQ